MLIDQQKIKLDDLYKGQLKEGRFYHVFHKLRSVLSNINWQWIVISVQYTVRIPLVFYNFVALHI